MPVDFACERCPVRFSIGWYHAGLTDGYGAATLAVCARCGAQHRIDQALDVSQAPSSHAFLDVQLVEVPPSARLLVMNQLRTTLGLDLGTAKRAVDTLPFRLRRNAPEQLARELETTYGNRGARVTLTETHRKLVKRPPLQVQDRLLLARTDPESGATTWRPLRIVGSRSGACGSFALDQQACGACKAAGAFVTDPTQSPTACPGCRSPINETSAWVT